MIHGATDSDYEYDDDPDRVDYDAVWLFLSTQADWGRWRTREMVDAQVRQSWRLVGAYHRPTGDLVGFARAVGDGLSLAYVADVYVLPEHRGRGLGLGLMTALVESESGAHLRWMLHTRDAHGLYAKLGFRPPDGMYLERPGRAPGSGS